MRSALVIPLKPLGFVLMLHGQNDECMLHLRGGESSGWSGAGGGKSGEGERGGSSLIAVSQVSFSSSFIILDLELSANRRGGRAGEERERGRGRSLMVFSTADSSRLPFSGLQGEGGDAPTQLAHLYNRRLTSIRRINLQLARHRRNAIPPPLPPPCHLS